MPKLVPALLLYRMKKYPMALTMLLVFFATNPVLHAQGGMPTSVMEAVRNRPSNVLVGTGSANIAEVETIGLLRVAAVTRAMVAISRQLESHHSAMTSMRSDYLSGAWLLEEAVATTLTNKRLQGVFINYEYLTADGNYWVARKSIFTRRHQDTKPLSESLA